MDAVEKQKVKPNDAIVMMMDSINKGDMGKFYQVAKDYMNTGCARGGDIFYRIQRLLKERPAQMRTLDMLGRNVKNLIIQGQNTSDGVTYLNQETHDLIDGLMTEWNNKELFSYHNISVRNKILLHGETGNGKTTIAKYMSTITDLPFVEVKSEEVISSRLGNTSSNIFSLLNEITAPCILFWDEIDSIGCKRQIDNDSAAGHENDRMTNAILTNLDRVTQNVIFIAATNRYSSLDSAFLRRFDVIHEIKSPSNEQKEEFAKQLISYYKIDGIVNADLDFSEITSLSKVKSLISGLARSYVLSQIKNQ